MRVADTFISRIPHDDRDLLFIQSRKQKGELLEDVAELLLAVPGVQVQKRVKLRPPGPKQRPREIDLLITGEVAWYPVRLPIECKNEKKVVGAPKIDAFRGKLELLGFPPQLGIYIPPTGFTQPALEAAHAVGIRALVLEGLTSDRLAVAISDALQSIVLYHAHVAEWRWEVSGIAGDDPAGSYFFDARSIRWGICWRWW